MSTASSQSRGVNRRINSLQNEGRHSRNSSLSRRRPLNANVAYSHAVRVAYLAYLLHPRSRRIQNAPAAPARPKRSSTSIHDLMSDFSLVRDSKSTRIPHGFVSELEKRLTGVLMGKEKRKEYQDHLVVRTFAAFLNTLKEDSFRKRMEKDRRAEDLVLIFYSNAIKELGKGKDHDDDSWKLMVDRHVALFVRLFGLILKDHDWSKDRPELANRLSVLENKLLLQDQDLMEGNGPTSATEAPGSLSYNVKDMPLVLHVTKIFGMTTAQAQSEIDKHKSIWTEKAALQDLKTYQAHLNLQTHKTLSRDDFESDEGYENWKKSEGPDLSQMMLAIVQSNPELAKSTPGSLPQFNPNSSEHPDLSRTSSGRTDRTSYVIDQPLDLSGLTLDETDESDTYAFIPSDPRAVYRYILAQTLSHDLRDRDLEASQATSDVPSMKLFSKLSTEMLNELCLRWRIPNFSRVVLFLDVAQAKFVDNEIDLDTLDSAFTFVKDTPAGQANKRSSFVASAIFDRRRWTVHDLQMMQVLLSKLHEALLRELYEVMMDCFEAKPRPIGPVMYLLETHIQMDPNYIEDPEDIDRFCSYVQDGLAQKATAKYQSLLGQLIPVESEAWDPQHVTELGDAITKLAAKIQKRYRNNPEIMGVNPYTTLCSIVLPMFAEDAHEMVIRILEQAKERGEEIAIDDGFELYKGLAAVRQLFTQTHPGATFPFHVETLLQEFVWRWLRLTDQKVMDWVSQATRQDAFTVRAEGTAGIAPEDDRHSVSVIDIFRSFNQVVESLVQLEWDDDLQYAKFMTHLSNSIGKGVATYCDSLEKMFARELDRLTPEQEAALNQTTQEKLMQFAKDTWTNKDKIEPFQFYSESLVKLNNIEYALAQLDKLENDINVDGCAEVIARNTPPQLKKVRKSTTYVFTIKVVEAEDLKACDIGGGSDPYVVLTDEYQKRIAKTRTIYNNLNPRWEDTVDLTTQGPLNMIATIWDWDAVGDHDYVGRTSIKLDPVHFSDFLPREYWLDLDTQGRLLLRVSMEGERDDIQFYFGKAFRTLKRTERDMTRKITEKLSAYISHCLSRRTLKSLLSRGISISSVSSFLNRNRAQPAASGPTPADVENALDPLFNYFNDNFAIMNKTLTPEAMKMVMARLWKEVLATIESLLVPPLSDKPSHQKPLTIQEVDIVSRWLVLLLNFFHAIDEETGEAGGVPIDILKSPKYHEIQSLNFFYFEPTENLIRTSERMASATVNRQQANRNRASAPAHLGVGAGTGHGGLGLPAARRGKSIMLSRNLGTMKKAKEEKRREAQADPNDDMILRILRMRPEAAGYLRDRSRQKERLAAAAAADAIVKQSLMAGAGSRMSGIMPRAR
ncbi:hypothetical protein PENANT_c018G00900 [Penicillium antarcticum]|uniref:C2 domain-containing protein n=1 Tax=Penicillium antarcticum TaxID=416450 RepID=A0A1V6Q151_9EURO|nr:hypothetical protein PENANT_c018G00900 [Penicillium antarcticum]